jgi:hypothetical protein
MLLCARAGYHAPVNFAVSVEPLLACMEHSHKVMEVIMPLTFTQGDVRCKFKYENDKIILSPAEALNGAVLKGVDPVRCTFCILPSLRPAIVSDISTKNIPTSSNHGPQVEWIYNSFEESLSVSAAFGKMQRDMMNGGQFNLAI